MQLADPSELGWRVATEYEANPLPSDSDDKQRIYKAEVRASRKVRADKLRRSKVRAWWYPRRSTVSSQFQPRTPWRYAAAFWSDAQVAFCFACGWSGHWKAECQ